MCVLFIVRNSISGDMSSIEWGMIGVGWNIMVLIIMIMLLLVIVFEICIRLGRFVNIYSL